MEIVHSDICGHFDELSLGKARYFITFIDDKSRKIFIYFLESKTGRKIKVLRTDNGTEYTNRAFQSLLKRSGIKHKLTNTYTPEQNGLAERNNRSIVEKMRCMIHEAGLEKNFWAEAAAYSVYLLNRSPTSGTGVTPEEMWTGKKPDLAHIRVFGSIAMAHIPKANRRKLDPKAVECIFTGVDENTKGYRFYDPVKKHFFKSRDCLVVMLVLSTRVNSSQIVSLNLIHQICWSHLMKYQLLNQTRLQMS